MERLILYPAAWSCVSKELLRAGIIGNAAFSTNLDQVWPLPQGWWKDALNLLPQHLFLMLCVSPFDFGEKFSNSLWLLWKSSSLSFWRDIWKLGISSVPFLREALAFLKWAGGRVPDTLIKLHIMKCQEKLTEYLCLLIPWLSVIASDYSITAEHFKIIVEIGCKCEATKAVLKLGKIMDRHPNCESVCPDLSQVGCYPGWIMTLHREEWQNLALWHSCHQCRFQSQGEFWLTTVFGIRPLLQKLLLVSSMVWAVIIW